MKLGMHVMTTETISSAYFINPSDQSVGLNVYPSDRCKTTAQLSNGCGKLASFFRIAYQFKKGS
jgi:hypothetical protein